MIYLKWGGGDTDVREIVKLVPDRGKVFYLCDGEVEKCKKTRCYKNGGDCNYTTNISHAKNFHKTDAPYPVFYENEAVPGKPDTAMVLEH